MFQEIPNRQIAEFADHFSDPQAQMAVESVAAGNTEAQLWVAAPSDDGGVVLLWDKGNVVFYLSGKAEMGPAVEALPALFAGVIRPQAIKQGIPYFKVCLLFQGMETILTHIFPDTPLHPVAKLFYTFRQPRANIVPAPGLDGIEFLPIDADLLQRTGLKNVANVEAEIRWMWTTPERFLQHGFGVAARLGDQLVSWCTAEYVSRSRCGIGIETVADYQKVGIASAAAARFVDESLRRGIVPHWECDGGNPASIRVAEKVGFDLIQKTTFWAGKFYEERL